MDEYNFKRKITSHTSAIKPLSDAQVNQKVKDMVKEVLKLNKIKIKEVDMKIDKSDIESRQDELEFQRNLNLD